jgi:hypothetical protein
MESDISVGVGKPVSELFDGDQIHLPGKVSNGQLMDMLNNIPLASVLQRRGEKRRG